MKINIVGAGLAGCEAAYQLSKNGYTVRLFENKSINPSPVQKIDSFAELVCSNTLRSKSKKNAVGILKEEMKLFDSLIIRAAYENNVPSDDALAVDRIGFSKYITNYIENDSNIEILKEDVSSIDDENEITIIASGPLTSEKLRNEIQRLIGNQKLYFMDASAPIIKKETIDFSKVYWSSRHKTNDGKYICIPLNEIQFNNFRNELINAEVVESKDFEKDFFFKGCQPIEQLAKIGIRPLLNGPMSPNQLENENGEIPFAVVQLRQDDAIDSLYNFVGFQTNMKWSEQLRVLKTLPGMENIEIVRYGVMHKNYYINSPKILNHKLQVKRKKNVFFAGQITGVEGYVESASSGIVASIGVLSLLNNQKMPILPRTTMIGALNGYITNQGLKHLNPMKANLGILDTQNLKKDELPEFFNYERAMNDLNSYLKSLKFYK